MPLIASEMQILMKLMPVPHYLLHEAGAPIEASLTDDQSDAPLKVLYAFSDKPTYDRFVANCNRDLRPYPLVRGFVARRIADKEIAPSCMAIDAETPDQKILHVATFQAVLESWDQQELSVRTETRAVRAT